MTYHSWFTGTPVRGAGVYAALLLAWTLLPKIGLAEQDSGPQADSGGGLTEIVVTATRREVRIQDVPLAVSAFSPENLTANRIQNTQDLQFLVPALLYNELGGYAQPFLRGIGTDLASPDADAPVATYIDGAYVADSQSTIEQLLGVERVEVLEGPQGTLFGRNSLAGAISITTLTPQQQFQAEGSVTQGNYGDTESAAHVSGGLTDNFAIGVYAAVTHSSSIYDREFVASEPRRNKNTGVRVKAVWDVTADFKLTGSVEYTYTQSPDSSVFRQSQPNSYGFALFGAPVVIAPWTVQNDYPFRNENHGFNATLREEWHLGPVDLLGITNYRQNRTFTENDLDATSADVLGSYAYQFNRQYSQELQILSPKGNALEYIAGLYYYHQDGGEVPTVQQSPFAFLPATNSFTTTSIATNSYAPFGQLTYSPVEKLRLTVGGRYTHETKGLYDGSRGLSSATGIENPQCCLLAPPTVYPNQSKTWSQFTPKVGVDYRLGGTLLYATFSEGFQAGVYSTTSPAAKPVNPEKIKAYEIGSKSDLWNNRLRANFSAYYYDFTDIQVQIDVQGNSQGSELEFLNAASAKAYGLEGNIQFAVSPEFQLSAQGAWEHSQYTRFPGFPAMVASAVGYATVPTDVAGNPLERAPKWVGSGSADYHTDIAGGQMKANLGLYYNGGFNWDPSNFNKELPYALLNGAVGYTFPKSEWTFTAWAKNITNRYYSVAYFPIVFGALTTDGMPRTYGATVSFKY